MINYHDLNLFGINNDDNEEHPSNIPLKLVSLWVFHLEISGKDNNDEQPQNIQFISVTLSISHLEIFGNDDNDEQLKNI